MRSKQHLNGMGTFGFIFMLVLVCFSLFLGWQIGPAYFNNKKVIQSLNSISEQHIISSQVELPQATNDVRNYMAKMFRVDNVDDVPLENIKVERLGDDYQISVTYEVRRTIIANIDVIISFSDSVKVTPR